MKKPKIKTALSIIIVTYNSGKYIKGCLSSIFQSLGKKINYEIIVIDNNSLDNTIDILKKISSKLILIKNNQNYGFAKAGNQGLRLAKGEFVLFLNPDTLVQKNAIKNLLAFIRKNPKVGIVGPLLIRPTGKLQKWQMGYEKVFWRVFLEMILEKIVFTFKPNWFLKIASLIDLNYADHYITREVDWVNGAAMMVRKKTLHEVGDFDERFFLYYEELDLQKRIKQAGWRIYHLPESIVIHYGKKSFHEKEYKSYLRKSRYLYFQKYYPVISSLLKFYLE